MPGYTHTAHFELPFALLVQLVDDLPTSIAGCLVSLYSFYDGGLRWQPIPMWIASALALLRNANPTLLDTNTPAYYTTHVYVCAVLLLLSAVGYATVHPFKFPTPTGRYRVGARVLQWHRDGVDHVQQAIVWYPTEEGVSGPRFHILGPNPRLLLNSFWASMHRKLPAWVFNHLYSLPTAAVVNAPLSTSSPDTSVYVYSHGMYAFPTLYTSFCEEVASHGNVIVAPFHSDGSCGGFVDFRTGELVKGFSVTWNDPDFSEEQAITRTRDIDECIDEVGMLFGDAVDTDNVCVVGHSFGGASSTLATLENDRIVTGLAFDTWLYPLLSRVGPNGYSDSRLKKVVAASQTRFLYVHSQHWQWAENLARADRLVDNSDGLWDIVSVKNSSHQQFDEVSYWMANWLARKMAGLGTVDHRTTIRSCAEAAMLLHERHLELGVGERRDVSTLELVRPLVEREGSVFVEGVTQEALERVDPLYKRDAD